MLRSTFFIIVATCLVAMLTTPALSQSTQPLTFNISFGTTVFGSEMFHDEVRMYKSSITGKAISIGLSREFSGSFRGEFAYQHSFRSMGWSGTKAYELMGLIETHHTVSRYMNSLTQIGAGVALGHLVYSQKSQQFSNIHGNGTTARIYGLASFDFVRTTRLQLKGGYTFGAIAADGDNTYYNDEDNNYIAITKKRSVGGFYASLGLSFML